MPGPTIRSYNKRFEALKSDRSSFMELWQELSDYHIGHRGRFLSTGEERNRGFRRNTRQVNNTSRLSVRTLASGMMAGITSPARPWFRLSSGDPELNENAAVKQWLHEVQQVMYRVYSSSNTYNALHSIYAELGTFGTAAMGVYEDFDNVIWCKPYTAGSYVLGTNGQNEVDTLYREYELTIGQLVKEFGYENCSKGTQEQWDRGNTEAWVNVMHVVEPNDDRDMTSPLARDMAYRAAYYETGRSGRGKIKGNLDNKFLRESGYQEFPIMAPRWDVISEDVYASDCPGMTTLGDTKQLQLAEKRKMQAVDKLANPPLQGPTSLKNKVNNASLGSNEIVWVEEQAQLESIYGNYRPDVNAIRDVIFEAQGRIQRGFYEDLFLSLTNTDRRQITAREVAERHEEKLLMLGPVLERLHTELLDPLIDRTFGILNRAGVLPVPPEELQGRELDVEYVSVLAQAQRMVAVSAVEQISGFTAQLAAVWPEVRHKIDATQVIDDYSDALGVNPSIIRSDDQAQELAAAEAQAQAQAQALQQSQEMANTAKTVSETDIQGDNALGAALNAAGITGG